MNIEGMSIVINGAARGIGAATAQMAASRGAKVTVSDLDDAEGQNVVDGINVAGGTVDVFGMERAGNPEATTDHDGKDHGPCESVT